MTAPIQPGGVERFRAVVADLLGLQFDDSKLGQLAEVLARRSQAASLSTERYLAGLRPKAAARDELRALARELTVGETYFFRNPDQFRALSDVALPERERAPRGSRPLRVLSAGCASGEEPYSIAILLAQHGAPSTAASIRAVDVNPEALARAATGRYSPWALRETSEEVQTRWFQRVGRDLVIDEQPRRLVAFEERNLAQADAELWGREAYDVVFCRNVLMYLTPPCARALVERIEGSLAPGGFLFLGHAETLRGLSQGFHLRHTHGTFYYQRRRTRADGASRASLLDAAADAQPLVGAVEGADTWIDAVRRASDRIHALALASGGAAAAAPAAGARDPGARKWELGPALELLKAERFGEALSAVERLPGEAAADPEVLLLRATLLSHGGMLDEAERACRELLGFDELNAGAHYLLALCREGRGDAQGAAHHDQLAAHLDPSFAMPRLHLGLLARRAGDRRRAGRELAAALELLRGEEAARLLLFGGGFSRQALAALCQAELAVCGTAP